MFLQKGANLFVTRNDKLSVFETLFKNGSPSLIEKISKVRDVNTFTDMKNRTALLIALKYKNVETAMALIKCGASLTATSKNGKTGLHYYLQYSQQYRFGNAHMSNLQFVYDLITKYKMNINAVDKKGRTPLHLLSTLDENNVSKIISVLLQLGADPNIQDNKGNTPLHLYLCSPFLESPKCKLDTLNKKGRTPFFLYLYRSLNTNQREMLYTRNRPPKPPKIEPKKN